MPIDLVVGLKKYDAVADVAATTTTAGSHC